MIIIVAVMMSGFQKNRVQRNASELRRQHRILRGLRYKDRTQVQYRETGRTGKPQTASLKEGRRSAESEFLFVHLIPEKKK